MVEKSHNDTYRTTLVCIDEYKDGIPKGRFYNSFLGQGRRFAGVMEFLYQMEDVLEAMEFPKAYTVTRSFSKKPPPSAAFPDGERPKGKEATFCLRVLFRQNASWQGSLTWLEGKKEESFRSVLELILLMNSALAA